MHYKYFHEFSIPLNSKQSDMYWYLLKVSIYELGQYVPCLSCIDKSIGWRAHRLGPVRRHWVEWTVKIIKTAPKLSKKVPTGWILLKAQPKLLTKYQAPLVAHNKPYTVSLTEGSATSLLVWCLRSATLYSQLERFSFTKHIQKHRNMLLENAQDAG